MNYIPKDISDQKFYQTWLVFVDVKLIKKNENGFKIACVKCGHGPQNHDDEYRAAARKNENQSQKRDADFG